MHKQNPRGTQKVGKAREVVASYLKDGVPSEIPKAWFTTTTCRVAPPDGLYPAPKIPGNQRHLP